MLTVGSLFSGIGGIDLGLERAGMKVLWQVEIDEWCRAVLAKHWPDVERFEDVRSVGARELPRVDLIAGGFPCQDISQAGQGAGIKEGTRSGLWFEFARIIRELRPHHVLVENVAILRGRGLDVVLGDLAESGYDAEWDCIPASAVGAPHQRDRIWIVGHRQDVECPDTDRFRSHRTGDGADESPHDPLDRFAAVREAVADAHGGGLAEHTERDSRPQPRFLRPLGDYVERYGLRTAWAIEPGMGRVANGVPDRVDRLRGLGNSVVPQVAELLGRWIVSPL